MDKVINLQSINNSFQDIIDTQNLSEVETKIFQENIEKLDFFLRKLKLMDIRSIGENKPNIELIKDIGFYLFGYLTLSIGDDFGRHIESFKKDGLNIGGLIFEILFEYIEENDENEDKKNYLFYSSVCYSLSGKESNSIFIAKKLEKIINNDDILYWVISKTLQRDFKSITDNVAIENFLTGTGVRNNIVQILYNNARLFVEGFDRQEDFVTNLNGFRFIKKILLDESITDLLFIVSKIEEVINEMIRNSVWEILLPLGFSRDYILSLTKYSDKNFYELWQGQREILQSVLSTVDKRILINMPTSGGKTFVAELIIINLLENSPNKKVVYVVPTNALANQIEEEFFYKLRSLGYRVSNNIDVGSDVSEIDEEMLILTPEKLDLIIRKNPNFIEQIGLFVFDEFHKIQDEGRGLLLETVITFLMLKQDIESCDYRIVTISAIVDNLDNINRWFGNENGLFQSRWTPTRKLYGVLTQGFPHQEHLSYDLKYKYYKISGKISGVLGMPVSINRNKKQIYLISSLIKKIYLKDKSPILVYFIGKNRGLNSFITLDCINQYWSQFGDIFISSIDSRQRDRLDDLQKYLKLRLSEDHPLTKIVAYGIGFHDGDLPKDVRIEIETAYKSGIIKLLLATSTLADGVNLPIKNLIFHNTRGLKIGDFRNIIGRAGRATKETEGNIYFINSEQLVSQLGNALSIKSSLDVIRNQEESRDFLDYISEIDENARLEFLEKFDRIQVYIYSTYEYIKNNNPTIALASIQEYISRTLYLKNKCPEQISEFHHINRVNYEKVENLYENDKRLLETINMTGLSDRSFRNLVEIVGEISGNYIFSDDFPLNRSDFENIISRDMYVKILEIKEFRTVIEKHDFGGLDNYNILLSWINGLSFLEIRDTFFTNENEISKRTSKAVAYLSVMFEYILPWAFSSVSIISEKQYDLPQDISIEIKLSPLKVKHGVKTNYGVELVKIGIEYHELLVSLEKLYIKEKGAFDADKILGDFFIDIKDWLLNYSFYNLEIELPILKNNISFIKNIGKVKNKIREKTHLLEEEGFLELEVRGVSNNEFRGILERIANKDHIVFQRDYHNIYDIFAVKIKYGDGILGYVPSEYSEEISGYLKKGRKLNVENLTNYGGIIKIIIS